MESCPILPGQEGKLASLAPRKRESAQGLALHPERRANLLAGIVREAALAHAIVIEGPRNIRIRLSVGEQAQPEVIILAVPQLRAEPTGREERVAPGQYPDVAPRLIQEGAQVALSWNGRGDRETSEEARSVPQPGIGRGEGGGGRSLAERIHQHLDPRGVKGIVAIEKGDVRSMRRGQSGVACRARAGVLLVNQAHLPPEAANHLRRAIGGAIIDHDYLNPGIALRQCRANRVCDEFRHVVGWNDDAYHLRALARRKR